MQVRRQWKNLKFPAGGATITQAGYSFCLPHFFTAIYLILFHSVYSGSMLEVCVFLYIQRRFSLFFFSVTLPCGYTLSVNITTTSLFLVCDNNNRCNAQRYLVTLQLIFTGSVSGIESALFFFHCSSFTSFMLLNGAHCQTHCDSDYRLGSVLFWCAVPEYKTSHQNKINYSDGW